MAIIFKNKPALPPAPEAPPSPITPIEALAKVVEKDTEASKADSPTLPHTPTNSDAPEASTRPPAAPQEAPSSPSTGKLFALAAEDPPWEPPTPNYSMMDALADLTKGTYKNKQLYLLRKGMVATWRVLGWDAETRRASLEGEMKMRINPVLTERENSLYEPFWK